ncbi:unnamed protein product [Polarella glacialis]|uniref:Cellulase n=1 Tax=Polarella glacialis TaxID=89957 RepID=A0A813HE30_POLGL|nr:unnamed protein product [Polarella glacialis]CAE8648643.1 unnamed protein product [Polarella glacialis]CAE8655785.1 unnamed protein product [Polarella glacialis]CAE8659998.1 unnamed protein product [Polarella glacialis]|mmetsp:Transcript_86238/g.155335  ORF Transcript_86238/g.155335 Transcript_86238/m.155335 type:complete len:243 (+) Transcript_86238:85-813(+)
MSGLFFALFALCQTADARLGGPNISLADNDTHSKEASDFLPGGLGRGMNYWRNTSTALNSMAQTAGEIHSMPRKMGYHHLATTTRYGDTCCASCGRMNTGALFERTKHHVVATAESMQGGGIGDGHYCTKDGSSRGGTVGMGCKSCGKGRFIAAHPMDYPLWAQPGDEIFEKEIHFVVADSCPHRGNEAWCPQHAGGENHFGIKNHFDFANPPNKFDNYYFAWSKVKCPREVQQHFDDLSQC